MERKEQQAIIAELYNENSCAFARNLLRLVSALIEEARLENDTARRFRVLHNQGKIEALKDLHNKITKGIPPKDDLTGINLT